MGRSDTDLGVAAILAVPGRRDVIRASGPDAASYLHGQLSQDITGLVVGASAWSLLLQPQGRVETWLRVTRIADDEFWLDADSGAGAAAVERLERFKLRVDCDFELHDWERVTLLGPEDRLGDLAWPGPDESWRRLPFLWPDLSAVDMVGPGVSVPSEVSLGEPADYERARIIAALPAMGAELTEQTIPAEAGVVEVSADFGKGCYVGQELVARVDSRGNNTPRRLRRLSGPGTPPDPGSLISLEGAEVGRVTSSEADGEAWVGLGYIKRASAHLESAQIGEGRVSIAPA